MKRLVLFVIGPSIFLFVSCTTYYIPIDSFKQQFSGIDSTQLKDVTVEGPMYMRYYYKANPIKMIQCVDKKKEFIELENSPSIEIRFTYGLGNKKAVFYFDRIYVSDSSVVGVQSRFVSAIRKTIPLKEVTKIEVQDGHKKFKYINN